MDPNGGGFGIGIIDKVFKVNENHYVGKTSGSRSYYYSGDLYKNGAGLELKGGSYKKGDIVAVDVDLQNKTLNFALNGDYLTEADATKFTADKVAVGVNMYYSEDSCTIIQHYTV